MTDEGMVASLSSATLGYAHDSFDSLDQLVMKRRLVNYLGTIEEEIGKPQPVHMVCNKCPKPL